LVSAADEIQRHIALVRAALHQCSGSLEPFDAEIRRVLSLKTEGDYGFIIDSYYLFEDTERAKEYVRINGLSKPGDHGEIGLAYLKFYGVMNACYMQNEATLVCARKLEVEVDRIALSNSPLIVYRNDFAAHSPNRGRGEDSHSFILDRFGLTEGRVAGYSSNSPGGFKSRDAPIQQLLSDWDAVLLPALRTVSETIISRVRAANVGAA
jgi:hypothetical protein